jgi:hypothetical protein
MMRLLGRQREGAGQVAKFRGFAFRGFDVALIMLAFAQPRRKSDNMRDPEEYSDE